MVTETPFNLDQFIQDSLSATEMACGRLLKTLSFVPDDKLHWSPTESSRSALQIAAHCGGANAAFAKIIAGEPMPVSKDPAEFERVRREAEGIYTDRESVIKLIEDSTKAVMDAIKNVTPASFGTNPDSPIGPMPMAFWMKLPDTHTQGHASQIDYLQTTWGDLEDHF
ncbi:MAG: hypothetical protein BGO01_07615 [Armatimonadetes bacterium 55-13]|nr:DinB family protein [Armatimonadota bacterium]OJU63728.1 MAG: hypothetical protein BGO01_07615 [Armatimonadetes bacterium 55-13]